METLGKRDLGSCPVLVAQLVERLTLDFGLGHDLTVVRSNLVLGSVLGMEPA